MGEDGKMEMIKRWERMKRWRDDLTSIKIYVTKIMKYQMENKHTFEYKKAIKHFYLIHYITSIGKINVNIIK
jgi:hypothetical protein